MKNILCFFLLLLGSKFIWGQQIEVSFIEHKNFYISVLEKKGKSDKIKSFSLDKKNSFKITYTPVLLNSYLPFSWKISDSSVFLISGYGHFPSNGNILIEKYKLETQDSLVAVLKSSLLIDELTKKYGSNSKALAKLGLEKLKDNNRRSLIPVKHRLTSYIDLSKQDYIDNILTTITYDFIPIDTQQLYFYIRTNKELTIWKYFYPSIGQKSSDTDWQEMITYSRDTIVDRPQNRIKNRILPSGEKHIFQSITDSLFFDGHIKVFQQKENTFIFNTKHGAIYHIGKEKIEKVGQLNNIDNYPDWILKKKIFIEDKDNQQIIFFGEVTRLNENLPFPNIQMITDKNALKEKFPYLLK